MATPPCGVQARQPLLPAELRVLPEHRMPQGGAERQQSRALSVPFPSPLEADIARGSLDPDAEPHREAIRKDLTVSGSVLAVCWRAEDAHLLRVSIINFLDQLSLVMRTMQRFGPPLSR
ncbi:EKC/KEOPS complex subunit LAGE3 [Phyllostomus hastatus]|uniref:EKC/KEOPS complex subunit LAGE3 n=1 Tax=Phyllostomus hastatus TaxID=9423 RepID=UPI001E6841F4|nr:EKC/KEOPS complex subunit LAGE3 [Phyllostomus hastatus]